MQAVAVEFSGCAKKPPPLFELRRVRKAGKSRAIAKRRRIPLLFGEESRKTIPAALHLKSQIAALFSSSQRPQCQLVRSMNNTKAYAAQSATDSLAPFSFQRRDVGTHDVQIEILP